MKDYNEFLEWLKENKISTGGKFKGKRWGSVNKSDDGDWHIRICVQYDEYLEPVLSNETAAMQELVRTRTGYEGCGRCIDGKCAFTGTYCDRIVIPEPYKSMFFNGLRKAVLNAGNKIVFYDTFVLFLTNKPL